MSDYKLGKYTSQYGNSYDDYGKVRAENKYYEQMERLIKEQKRQNDILNNTYYTHSYNQLVAANPFIGYTALALIIETIIAFIIFMNTRPSYGEVTSTTSLSFLIPLFIVYVITIIIGIILGRRYSRK